MTRAALAHHSDRRQAWLEAFRTTRALSLALAAPLSEEDRGLQSMPDASPTKWHLAHTTWFFETMVLAPLAAGYRVFHPAYAHLFNSYYEALGSRHPRPERGMLSRPSSAEIMDYRAHVEAGLADFVTTASDAAWQQTLPLLTLGLHHEQQHQELILTDIKHALSRNPLNPAYLPHDLGMVGSQAPLAWIDFPGGLHWIGAEADADFAFDNEGPRHQFFLQPFRLASRPATNGEYLAFMREGGYARAEFWLSEGWAMAQAEAWQAPAYWEQDEKGHWRHFTLHGLQAIDPAEPVTHVSFYEAAAFAAWSGARLPTEFEWELAAATCHPDEGRFLDLAQLHPQAAPSGGGLQQMFGDVWQWTRSAYAPYPGFQPPPGAVGEYNGKFMVNQIVLRGGSCATPPGHIRASYRNFFPAAARWQFSGIRLAVDA